MSDGRERPLAFGRHSRIWFALFLVAVLFLAASLFHTINVPWVEEDNVFGAAYAQAACNNLRAGLSVTAGVPATFYVGALPIRRNLLCSSPVLSFAGYGIGDTLGEAGHKQCRSLLDPECLASLDSRWQWSTGAAAFAVAF
jgi:hypothetical protein